MDSHGLLGDSKVRRRKCLWPWRLPRHYWQWGHTPLGDGVGSGGIGVPAQAGRQRHLDWVVDLSRVAEGPRIQGKDAGRWRPGRLLFPDEEGKEGVGWGVGRFGSWIRP